MKTGKAVLVSVAIMAAVLSVAGGVGYWIYRAQPSGAGPASADTAAESAGADNAEADRDAASGGACASQADDNTLARAILAPAAQALQATERPVARIALEALAKDEVRLSKVGGRAYWAAGRDYPRGPAGEPLALLAQLDLAELRDMPGFPHRGLLQFFIDGDDYYGAALDAAPGQDRMSALAQQRGFRVVYWPDASVPPVAPPALSRRVLDELPFDPAKPRRIRLQADHETLGLQDARLAATLGGDLDALVERYTREHPDERRDPDWLAEQVAEHLDRTGHKLGGHPDFTQSDPRRPDDRRVLLLQLDSDEALMWGDSGIANFFIDPDDLARADFSRVAFHWDCY